MMKIFKKNDFNLQDKRADLLALIQIYDESKNKTNKIKTEYSTYWLGGACILGSLTIMPFIFFPAFILPIYVAGILYRLKYNKWTKSINKAHNNIMQDIYSFLKSNEKEIMKGMFKDIRNKELEDMFEKIMSKCATNEYDENLIYEINNFFFKLNIIKQEEIRQDKVMALKKIYQIPDEKENYNTSESLKEKYMEMC